MNPYMKFVKENRDGVVKDNPDFSFGDIGKELGRMWRGLSDSERTRYYDDVEMDDEDDEEDEEEGVDEDDEDDSEEDEDDSEEDEDDDRGGGYHTHNVKFY